MRLVIEVTALLLAFGLGFHMGMTKAGNAWKNALKSLNHEIARKLHL